MRRLLAISLLLLFGLPLVSPLFALSTNPDANLPACCRRNGAHHCTMNLEHARTLTNSAPSFTAPSRCPFYPGIVPAVQHNDARLHKTVTLHATFENLAAAANPADHVFVRVLLDTAWQKRGPPAPTA
ncbi:MAG TPA: hypothetical protein VFE38_17110 [Edaphobacter sp.]|nr:hypothetical protein [Edaphobacter sp.]